MWTKKESNNLVIWSPRKSYELRVLEDKDEFVKEFNKQSNTIEFSNHKAFYHQEVENTIKELPAGIYRYEKIDYEMVLVELELQTKDSFIDLSVTKEIQNDFKQFLESKDIYQKFEMPFKRGVLMFGPPGTGKTFTTRNIISKLVNKDTIVIFSDKALTLSIGKELQKDPRMKIIVFEEFTNILRPDWMADEEILDFLDGEAALNNAFIIATTNYPEKMPINITQRPGRFDKFYKVGYLTPEDIKKYLNHFNIEPEECILTKEDLTIAQLKEIMLLTVREGLSFNQALNRLEDHMKLAQAEFTQKNKLGFIDD